MPRTSSPHEEAGSAGQGSDHSSGDDGVDHAELVTVEELGVAGGRPPLAELHSRSTGDVHRVREVLVRLRVGTGRFDDRARGADGDVAHVGCGDASTTGCDEADASAARDASTAAGDDVAGAAGLDRYRTVEVRRDRDRLLAGTARHGDDVTGPARVQRHVGLIHQDLHRRARGDRGDCSTHGGYTPSSRD